MPKVWISRLQDIRENDLQLTASRYKPFSLEDFDYDPPEQIVEELQKLETNIQQGLRNLMAMIEENK
jgi:type I restriction enzyme M protein